MGQTFETVEQRAAFRALKAAGVEPERAAQIAREQNPGEPERHDPAPAPRGAKGDSSPGTDAVPGAREFGAALDGIGDRLDRVESILRSQGWDL